jgi:hypothetical protein
MNSNFFDIFLPWLGLAAVVWPLLRIQRYIHRHLFGVGFIISKQRGLATLLFYLALGPGVILHEISRYLVAGMFRIIPTGISFFPEEQQDGTFDLGFVQFGLILNPVYRAIIDLVPLSVGIVAVIAIGGWALGWTDFISSLRTMDIYVIGPAAQTLVNKPDFVLWSYILFGITNTMIPTRKEARGLWLPIAMLVAFLSVFAVFGVWQAIVRLMNGPVANIVYGLTAVFGVVLFINCLAASLLWIIERVVSGVTRREVQYAPPVSAVKVQAKPKPRSVFELQLPLPPPPGKPGFKARLVTTLPVPASESRPAVPPERESVTIEKPERAAIGAPTPAPKPAALGAGSKTGELPAATAAEPPIDEPLAEPAKPKGLFGTTPAPLATPMPAPKPAAATIPSDTPAKAKESAEVAKPATPTPAPAVGAAGAKPSPFVQPTPAATPSPIPAPGAAQPATPSPFGQPKPAEAAKPATSAPASPFGSKAPVAQPAPAASAVPGGAKPSPFAPKSPTPGAAGSSANLPALRPAQQPAAAPKSPFPAAKKPSPLSSPTSAYSDDDVIEGEVVDEDDAELKYVDSDEA